MMGIEPGATGSGSKYANHSAMLPTLLSFYQWPVVSSAILLIPTRALFRILDDVCDKDIRTLNVDKFHNTGVTQFEKNPGLTKAPKSGFQTFQLDRQENFKNIET